MTVMIEAGDSSVRMSLEGLVVQVGGQSRGRKQRTSTTWVATHVINCSLVSQGSGSGGADIGMVRRPSVSAAASSNLKTGNNVVEYLTLSLQR